MGIEINRLTRPNSTSLTNLPPSYHRISTEPSMAPDADSPPSSPQVLRLNHLDRDLEDDTPSNASTGETAGIYLGILNLYTTLPQFVGTFISMCVFAILEPGKHAELAGEGEAGAGSGTEKAEGVNAIAVCLFIGALSSIGAAWATRRFGFVK
jgi:solute carrier family 45 protein 1/2/4